MRRIIALGLVLAASPALAEPKTVILDNCVKVETELRGDVRAAGQMTTITVKCTGEATDPKVREPGGGGGSIGTWTVMPKY